VLNTALEKTKPALTAGYNKVLAAAIVAGDRDPVAHVGDVLAHWRRQLRGF